MTGQLREAYRRWAGRSPLWTPLHLHHRALDAFVKERAPRVIDQAGATAVRVLDVGCGDLPYKRFFDDPRVAAYDGADIAGAQSQATLEIDPATQAISAETASYDVVVSFQVLEHSSHPLALLRECRRVLRPNGVLMLTLPFVFEYHAVPGDFRRWTTEGITEDLQDCGYADVVAEPIETDLHSLLVVNELFVSRHLGYVATKPLFLALNLAALAAAKLKAPAHRILPLTLGVVARRPA